MVGFVTNFCFSFSKELIDDLFSGSISGFTGIGSITGTLMCGD